MQVSTPTGMRSSGVRDGIVTAPFGCASATGASYCWRPVLIRGARSCIGVEFLVLDDGAEDAASTDDLVTGASLDSEHEKSPIMLGQSRGGADGGSGGDSLQMVHFDARADGNRSRRQFRHDCLSCGNFHQADHMRRGKYGGQARIERSDSPLMEHDFFDARLQAGAEL
jgi:hypothetical protein